MEVGDGAGALDVRLGSVFIGVEQVLPDGAVEEVRLLGHHADLLAEVGQIEVPHVYAANAHGAAGNVVEPGDQIHHRGLAAAGSAHDGEHPAAGHGEVDIRQQGLFRVVGEGYVVVGHVRVGDVGGLAVFRGLDGIGQVEVVKDAGEQCQGSGEVHVDVQQGLDGAVQPVHQGHRGGDGAHRQGGVGPGDDEVAAGEVDQQRAKLGEHAHDDAEPLAAALLLELQVGDLTVDGHEPLILPLLAGEQLHQQRAADGQRLVDQLVHLVVLGLTVGEDLPAGLAHALGGQDQQRDYHDAHQRQAPAHGEQGHQRGDHHRQVADDAAEGAGDDRADAADVGIHAGDDVALLLRGEKGVGHVLEVIVHLVLHIEDDLLGDPGVDVALQHANDLGGGQRQRGEDQQLDQQGHVPAHQRLVHDAAGDDAGQQAHHRREENGDEHHEKLEPVGLQIGQDPLDQRTGHLGPVLLLLVRQEAAGAEGSAMGRGHGRHFLFLFLSVLYAAPPPPSRKTLPFPGSVKTGFQLLARIWLPQRGQVMMIFPLPRGTRHTARQRSQVKKQWSISAVRSPLWEKRRWMGYHTLLRNTAFSARRR